MAIVSIAELRRPRGSDIGPHDERYAPSGVVTSRSRRRHAARSAISANQRSPVTRKAGIALLSKMKPMSCVFGSSARCATRRIRSRAQPRYRESLVWI